MIFYWEGRHRVGGAPLLGGKVYYVGVKSYCGDADAPILGRIDIPGRYYQRFRGTP